MNDPSHDLAPITVTHQDYRFLAAEQAQECGIEQAAILIEPTARNTATAIAAACFVVAQNDASQLVHVLPSDHEINVDGAYLNALDIATGAAQAGQLTTFGITPTQSSTGFGYIEAGEALPSGVLRVNHFVEKPDAERANAMLEAGNYYWNSGMFLFRASSFLNEYEKLAPEVYRPTKKSVADAQADLDFARLGQEGFSSAPDISVNCAIFEKTKLATVAPSPIVWSYLGSWDAVWKAGPRDKADNLARGPPNKQFADHVANTAGGSGWA